MDKVIDFSRTVYELCREYPEVIDIMKELGFENITNPAMLNTAGRFMTVIEELSLSLVLPGRNSFPAAAT